MKRIYVRLFLAGLIGSLIFFSGGLFAQRGARASAPETYQYKCVPITSDQFRQDEVQSALNREAHEGWKLVSSSSFAYPMSNGTGGTIPGVTTVLVLEKK